MSGNDLTGTKTLFFLSGKRIGPHSNCPQELKTPKCLQVSGRWHHLAVSSKWANRISLINPWAQRLFLLLFQEKSEIGKEERSQWRIQSPKQLPCILSWLFLYNLPQLILLAIIPNNQYQYSQPCIAVSLRNDHWNQSPIYFLLLDNHFLLSYNFLNSALLRDIKICVYSIFIKPSVNFFTQCAT